MDIIETAEDLAMRAKLARIKAKETQKKAAERFDVHPQTISDAENAPDRPLTKLRQRIIETYEDVTVSQVWIIKKKDGPTE